MWNYCYESGSLVHTDRQQPPQFSYFDKYVFIVRVLSFSLVARVGLEVRGGAQVVNGRGPRRGVGVALSFLVEGQQRHVRHLDDLLLNPRDNPRNNHCYHPFVTAFVTAKNPFVTAKTLS